MLPGDATTVADSSPTPAVDEDIQRAELAVQKINNVSHVCESCQTHTHVQTHARTQNITARAPEREGERVSKRLDMSQRELPCT